MLLRYAHVVGILIILHAGYSFVQHKQLAEYAGLDALKGTIPVDVLLEIVLGFVVALYGALANAGTFQPIAYATHVNARSWDDSFNQESFRLFNHRGKFLSQRLKKAAKR